MKTTKAIKLKIIKPKDVEWDVFNNLLVNIRNDTFKIKNRTVQLAWDFNNLSRIQKEKIGEQLKANDIFGKNFNSKAYEICKNEFPLWYSSLIGENVKLAEQQFNINKIDMEKGLCSVPSFKRNTSIGLKSGMIKLNEEEDRFVATLNLISKQYAKEIGRKNTSYSVTIGARDKSTKKILKKIIDKKYKQGAGKIIKEKDFWFLVLSYSFESEKKTTLKNNGIMGIDLGISKAATIAFNTTNNYYFIDGGEIEHHRKQVESRRRQLLRAGKYSGGGRVGHGRRKRIEPILKLSKKAANFRETTNHKYSKYIVELAIKHNVERIQMENLKNISKSSKFLSSWSYYDLQTKIEYKAKEKGIEVIKINPRYTSQRCSRCGHIDDNNRSTQETFQCIQCHFKTNADINAARNIAKPNIEELIRTTVKNKKKDKEIVVGFINNKE